MRIFIINPDYGVRPSQMAVERRILSDFTGEDVELHMECLTETPVEIDSAFDVALAATEILHLAGKAQQQSYDAIVLYCFSDPILDACREMVNIPVVGAGQAACLLAPVLGRQAGLLLADGRRLPEKRQFVTRCGVAADCITAFTAIDADGVDLWLDRPEVQERLAVAGERLLKESGVQVLILGCLSFLAQGLPLAQRLGVPVIDPAIAAVSLAESLVRQRLTTSRRAYPRPPHRPHLDGELGME